MKDARRCQDGFGGRQGAHHARAGRCAEGGDSPMAFGVSEYTLVFRRALNADNEATAAWTVARPGRRQPVEETSQQRQQVAALFVAPIYSTLALDDRAYEQFLW